MTYSLLSKYRSQLMGAAILWVMLFHAQPPVPFAPLNALFRAGFGGVDIFIVLSAVGLVCSLSRRQQDRAAFLSRRAAGESGGEVQHGLGGNGEQAVAAVGPRRRSGHRPPGGAG